VNSSTRHHKRKLQEMMFGFGVASALMAFGNHVSIVKTDTEKT
jgi:hypothetical protein